LTVFDPVEGFTSAAETNRPDLVARLEVQNLIREVGLIDEAGLEAFHEIEPEMAGTDAEAKDVATDKEDLPEETNKRPVTLVPGLPAG
jgi:hypothetical protein